MVIERTFDAVALSKRMSETEALREVNCDIQEWVDDRRNVALNKDGDFGVFEFAYPGAYIGHYFFKSRGRKAIDTSLEMLSEMFSSFGAEMILGLTPVEHRAAVWMTRHLGFKEQRVVSTDAGRCHIFTLSKNDYKDGR